MSNSYLEPFNRVVCLPKTIGFADDPHAERLESTGTVSPSFPPHDNHGVEDALSVLDLKILRGWVVPPNYIVKISQLMDAGFPK
jgi:hypothetical protein